MTLKLFDVQWVTMRRMTKELKDLKSEPLGGISVSPIDDNVLKLKATIVGPPLTHIKMVHLK